MRWFWLLLLSGLVRLPLIAQTPAFVTDSLDAYIRKGMAECRIPGLAIAIVKDGKVILSKGYGVQEVGKAKPVDENTLFMIASNTKLFTGTAFALLEEQKKLSLDDKVQKYLPDFALHDSAATQMVTIRDLLSHRLGTKDFQGDFLFWDTDLKRQDVVRRMRLFRPPNQFRQDYGYSNQGYVAAGEIIPRITGQPWEVFMENSLLKPLMMSNTFMLTAGIDKRPDVAQPYTTCCNAEGKLTKIPFDNLDNLGPATSMVSSVKDMAKWLMMQLDSGRVNNTRIIPWPVLEKTRTVNTIVSTTKATLFPIGDQFYCLGVGRVEYAGHSVYAHWGGASGYRSNTTFVPEKKLGIVVLTNQDNHNFPEALRFQLLDAYLNLAYTDRHQYFLKRSRAKDQKARSEIKALDSRVAKKTEPVVSLLAYTGIYQNDLYGTLSITKDSLKNEKQSLKIRFEHHQNLTAQLEYMDGNEFRLTFSNPRFGIFPAKFTLSEGRVERLVLKGTDFVDHDSYEFKKIND